MTEYDYFYPRTFLFYAANQGFTVLDIYSTFEGVGVEFHDYYIAAVQGGIQFGRVVRCYGIIKVIDDVMVCLF